MKNKVNNLLLIFSIAISVCSCSLFQKEKEPTYIAVATESVTPVSNTEATVVISVVPYGMEILEMGVCYGLANNPNVLDHTVKIRQCGEQQKVPIENLEPDKRYFVRAFATTTLGVYYGETLSFYTGEITFPEVKIDSVYNIKETSASIAVSLIADGGDSHTRIGIYFANHPEPTAEDTKIGMSIDNPQITLSNLVPGQTYCVRPYATNQKGITVGNEISFTTYKPKEYSYPTGTVKGAFSVSSSKVVGFSSGNLQYTASTGIWAFASQQYEICGGENTKISSTCTTPIDLFGYGTSGYEGVQPYLSTTTKSAYVTGDIQNTEYDWGVHNAISNGGNSAHTWRTLNHKEWEYVINRRPNAKGLVGLAIVNSVYGLLLLPDSWMGIDGISFTASLTSYSNNYTVNQFAQMEEAGAVFLPLCGCRISNTLQETNKGLYWASDYHENYYACYLGFSMAGTETYGTILVCAGLSVRLVQDLQEK